MFGQSMASQIAFVTLTSCFAGLQRGMTNAGALSLRRAERRQASPDTPQTAVTLLVPMRCGRRQPHREIHRHLSPLQTIIAPVAEQKYPSNCRETLHFRCHIHAESFTSGFNLRKFNMLRVISHSGAFLAGVSIVK
jgi:hypothetical protein